MEDIVHSGAARRAVLTSNLGGTTSDLTLFCDAPLTGWPQPTGSEVAYLIVNKTGSTPEKMLISDVNIVTGVITVWSSGLSTGRAADGTSIASHQIGEYVEHVWTAGEADDLVEHVNATEAHGSDGNIVGANTLAAELADYATTTELTDAVALLVPKSVLDAKGDLIGASAADTPVKVTVGTDYKVLQADSAQAAGVGYVTAGMRLTGSASPSLAASVSVNDCFRSAGKFYRIMYRLTTPSTSRNVLMQMRVGGVNNTSANYYDSAGTSAGTSMIIATIVPTSGWGYIDVFSPADAVATTFAGLNAATVTAPSIGLIAGAHNVPTAYDGFTFTVSSGDTMTGEIRVYELANA